ncbi:MAG: hypothetical protein ACREN1_02665 [Candidatus Dormibacteria bacterium]
MQVLPRPRRTRLASLRLRLLKVLPTLWRLGSLSLRQLPGVRLLPTG